MKPTKRDLVIGLTLIAAAISVKPLADYLEARSKIFTTGECLMVYTTYKYGDKIGTLGDETIYSTEVVEDSKRKVDCP
jgi:hypothetical protein